LAGSADYARDHERAQLFASASTYFNFLHDFDGVTTGTHAAHLGTALPLPARGTLRATQAAAYSPSYLYALFPDAPTDVQDGIATHPDYRINALESISYQTNLSVAYGSARKTRVTANADYRVSDFPGSAMGGLETHGAGMRFSRALSRSATLSTGYDYTGSLYSATGDMEEHRALIGIEYSLAVSATRRIALRLELAPTIFNVDNLPQPDDVVPSESTSRFHFVQGEASVDYPFHPRWRASVSYRRGLNYVPLLTEPLFSDSGMARLAGVLSRRTDVSASAGYSTSQSPPASSSENLRTYTGEVRIRYALRRNLAAYSEYLHHQYDFRGRVRLVEGLPVTFAQRSIRVGLTLFSRPIG
jgi:hypothetical protein